MGESADLISLDAEHEGLIAREGDALIDGWVFAAGRGAIDCVWRHGERVVSGGRHRARAAIVARYRRTLAGLLS